ncbi:F-box only protein 36, partial [Silurus meridionalis]
MAQLLGETVLEVSAQGPAPIKDYYSFRVTQTEVIWRWWKISLRLDSRSMRPGEVRESHSEYLEDSRLQVHHNIQRFRESGTISVCKGEGWKTIPDACDLRALRRHCITYRNATVMEITTWAQENFQKTLSVNTIHRAIRRRRLKLYRSKKKPSLNMIQKLRCFLRAKADGKWKTVLWSDESKSEVLFGKLGRHVIQTKEDKDNPSCSQCSVQKLASLM